MIDGMIAFTLHAHLPFVRHPEHPDFLEEDWLFEAIHEVYLPLLEILEGLDRDGVAGEWTMSITPTLAAMLDDDLLCQRCVRYFDNLIDLTKSEMSRNRWIPELKRLATHYHETAVRRRDQFVNRFGKRLLPVFRRYDEKGRIELITSAATHGYLPLMPSRAIQFAQIEIGCREFERHFGRRPRGIWLPECGYVQGIDLLLRDAGIEFFFLESHGATRGDPPPNTGVFAPIRCAASDVVAFARDSVTARQVWSAADGYPSDPWYRDFHRDIGYDLELGYLRRFLHGFGGRSPTSVKYHRITGPTDRKAIYDAPTGARRAGEHAGSFLNDRLMQFRAMKDSWRGNAPPVLCAPYDAELFGHWWYEGPIWFDQVFREMNRSFPTLKAVSTVNYLRNQPPGSVCQPAESSWGNQGSHETWLDPKNDWIYPSLHAMADRMVRLAHTYPNADGLAHRALNQAARELLLAQSSDWAFIMKTGSMVEYARRRTLDSIENFHTLDKQLSSGKLDPHWIGDLEYRHNLFPTLDYRIYLA